MYYVLGLASKVEFVANLTKTCKKLVPTENLVLSKYVNENYDSEIIWPHCVWSKTCWYSDQRNF